jgi:hypothetical protein
VGDIRIHRSDPARFVKIPNPTIRDGRLSWAARGYLAEMMSLRPDTEPESTAAAAARAKRERAHPETPRGVRVIHAELEQAGYRHRVRRRGDRGRIINETHYYDLPTTPCPDERTCNSCTPYEQGELDITAGGTGSTDLRGRSGASTGASDMTTRRDLVKRDVSPGQPADDGKPPESPGVTCENTASSQLPPGGHFTGGRQSAGSSTYKTKDLKDLKDERTKTITTGATGAGTTVTGEDMTARSATPAGAAAAGELFPMDTPPTPPTAQTLLTRFIDWDRDEGGTLTSRTTGQLAKYIAGFLSDGIDERSIRQGLADWRRAGQHPATLNSFVDAAMRGPAQRTQPGQMRGGQSADLSHNVYGPNGTTNI